MNTSGKNAMYGILWFALGLLVLILFSPLVALILFAVSTTKIFNGLVSWNVSQLKKGSYLLFAGTGFTAVLGIILGFYDIASLEKNSILPVSKFIEPAYYLLILIVGGACIGAGGSLVANHAATLSSDAPETKVELNESQQKTLISALENKVETTISAKWKNVKYLYIAFTLSIALNVYLLAKSLFL